MTPLLRRAFRGSSESAGCGFDPHGTHCASPGVPDRSSSRAPDLHGRAEQHRNAERQPPAITVSGSVEAGHSWGHGNGIHQNHSGSHSCCVIPVSALATPGASSTAAAPTTLMTVARSSRIRFPPRLFSPIAELVRLAERNIDAHPHTRRHYRVFGPRWRREGERRNRVARWGGGVLAKALRDAAGDMPVPRRRGGVIERRRVPLHAPARWTNRQGGVRKGGSSAAGGSLHNDAVTGPCAWRPTARIAPGRDLVSGLFAALPQPRRDRLRRPA